MVDVTATCPPGSSLAFVGPNGSGKSTLLRLAARLITPSSGNVSAPAAISYVPGTDRQFYDRLTGWENLRFQARVSGTDSRAWREAGEAVELGAALDEPLWTYSSGMKVRLALARALALRRPLLLLDEPTRALDESGRQLVFRLVQEEVARGVATLIATHDRELAASCDRVLLLDRGRVVRAGPGGDAGALADCMAGLESAGDGGERTLPRERGAS